MAVTTQSSQICRNNYGAWLGGRLEGILMWTREQGTAEVKGLTASCLTLPVHGKSPTETLDTLSIGLPIVYRGALPSRLTAKNSRSEARAVGESGGSATRRSAGKGCWQLGREGDLDPGEFSLPPAIGGVSPRTNFVHTPRTDMHENRPSGLDLCHA